MIIELDQVEIPLELRKHPRARLGLRFGDYPPRLILEHPKGILDDQARAFIQQKKNWILKHFANISKSASQIDLFWEQIKAGKVLYLGEWREIVTTNGRSNKASFKDGKLHIQLRPSTDASTTEFLYAALRALARLHLNKRTIELAKQTQSYINNVRVKDLRSKWGSCSSKSNVNLNWYLIFLAEPLVDYVIIHELMHLREMNHSPAYWAEVAKYVPNYKKLRAEVQKNAWLIGIFEKQAT